ncbi:sulfurtransferase complex subunit TusD [Microbulbifer thermotolerans]|uniref:Sulfurtransferase complex subunit TusD n=1 Tax=Microbulbifer thermotolerans TaxID=252514 RepID=A0A143HL93_MICTH|nr:sulfurtransferase complex subunit TusD [Microbulbifer thermotolerans]AMX02484.1 tRNA 2-thiouridine(34) synthase TusD [Microbulbifer thermotolerans]MCX2779335.1 sulfurtransferase complex subunit TusD [Microbulbifer thermotolerans]MCX2782461.1 sulfurtransferase complex subunit TusD [Microbulbifer thermotolerans]MCX2795046.1 sulfurtransferase complex subunit TusD [Microbulbifer thermotolerans]MCX2800614.1 sulfurtransferase complex subunit TusD [Microbulbifer thermotolerans]
MKFALAVHSAPHTSQSAASALRFARALLAQGHELYRVFFYCDGVHNGSVLAAPPQDEADLVGEWQALQQAHGLDLVVCIAAAQRRGVLSESEAGRLEKSAANLAPGFELAGLGQLADAIANADRLVTFGG